MRFARLFLGADDPEHPDDVLGADRLQAIVLDSDADRLPGVFEFIMAAQDDDFDARLHFADDRAQLQTVHERHADVRDQNVRLQFLDERQRQLAVGRIPAIHKPFLLPIDAVPHVLANDNLIIHQEHFLQGASPLEPES